MRRILTLTIACLVLGGASATGAHAAGRLPALCDGSWRYPKPIPHPEGYTLKDIAAVGQRDVWIVGAASDGLLTLHWNGQNWIRIPATSPGQGKHAALSGVAAGPRGDVWAVGRASNGPDARVFVLHWNGTEWTLAHVPP
jgi:hypothetical protein